MPKDEKGREIGEYSTFEELKRHDNLGSYEATLQIMVGLMLVSHGLIDRYYERYEYWLRPLGEDGTIACDFHKLPGHAVRIKPGTMSLTEKGKAKLLGLRRLYYREAVVFRTLMGGGDETPVGDLATGLGDRVKALETEVERMTGDINRLYELSDFMRKLG